MVDHPLNSLVFTLCLTFVVGSPFYFRYWIKSFKPSYAAIERMTTFLTTLIFIGLFLGAFIAPKELPKMAQVLFFGSMLSFAFLYQTRANANQLNSAPETQTSNSEVSGARSFRPTLVKIGFCLLGLIILSVGRNYPIALLSFVSLPFLHAFYIKALYPSQEMQDSPLKEAILDGFKKCKVQSKSIRLLESSERGTPDALIAGQTLFLNLKLFETLNHEELHAVVLHEAAHLSARHGIKRTLWGITYLALGLFWFVLPAAFLFPETALFSIFAALFALGFQFHCLGNKIYDQELEADGLAIQAGATKEALSSALRKLMGNRFKHQPAFFERLIIGNFHPSGLDRELALFSITPKEEPTTRLKLAYTSFYSLFVLGILIWSSANLNLAKRMPATETPTNSANISH